MTEPDRNGTIEDQLFEINLIGESAAGLRRRQAMERFSLLAMFVMLAAAALFSLKAVGHVTRALRVSSGIGKITRELSEREGTCQELDVLRSAAVEKVGRLSRLASVAGARVALSLIHI